MDDWTIRLREIPGRFDLELWIFRRANGGSGTEVYYGDTTEVFPSGVDVRRPSMVLSPFLLQALMGALSEKGITPDTDSFVKGKLEATEGHLQDLRHLLKLPIEYVINTREEKK